MFDRGCILTTCLLTLAVQVAASGADFGPVRCEGSYPHHLQGVCIDGKDAIFWSFTTRLVKTDRSGKALKQVEVGNHHGDLCYRDGKVYVAVNFGKFNDARGNADSWVYVYDADDLTLLSKHATPEVVHGAGGIAWHDGRLLVVGGLPAEAKENLVYEYDESLQFLKGRRLSGGYTLMGIQTAAFADGKWWFGCYGKPAVLLTADEALREVQRFDFNASLGIVPLGGGRFLIGRDKLTQDKKHEGSLVLAEAEELHGLQLAE